MQYLSVENVLLLLAFLGALGNALSLLPFAVAKAAGRVLSGASVDFVKVVQAFRGRSTSGKPL